jgi:hypothetical protein
MVVLTDTHIVQGEAIRTQNMCTMRGMVNEVDLGEEAFVTLFQFSCYSPGSAVTADQSATWQ